MARLLIFVGFSFWIISCGNKKITTNYPNGSLMEQYETSKDGQKDGAYKSYYDNGKIREEATYKAGEYIGTRTLYFENGGIDTEENYSSPGILGGPYKTYYKEGGVHIVKNYQENVMTGTLIVYYPNGQIKEEVTMADNQENGPFQEYFQNGQLQWKGTYLNGDNEFGLLEEWDSLGNMVKRMKCDSLGICRTFWKPGMPEVNYDTVKPYGYY
ncbi:MAG: toxin-antitoxin system YwqK family antitoxin [Chitinophagales bacterium]|nr:toxin-antitoxin system YwqK family antitoxin [Chitinophagales bacterium]